MPLSVKRLLLLLKFNELLLKAAFENPVLVLYNGALLILRATLGWPTVRDFSTEAAGGNSPLARVPPTGNGRGYHRPGK